MVWIMLLAAIAVSIIWKLLACNEKYPLDKVPGPPRRPVLGNVLLYIGMTQRDLFLELRKLTKTYGDRYYMKIFNRKILHINSPDDIEVVLSHSRNITKSLPYDFLQPWLGSGLLLSTGSKWHRRRKILTPTFHFNILKNFARVIEEKSRDMVNKLKMTNEVDINLMPVVSDFTLYTVCETAMGTKLDTDKSAATIKYKNAVLDMGYLVLERITKFWLQIDFIFNMLPISKKYKECLNTVLSFADNVIMEKKKTRDETDTKDLSAALKGGELGSKKRLAMLDLLLEAERKGEIDLEGIREEVNTFVFEGHDTTATALTFCIMVLADHEDAQDRIYEELQSIFGDSNRTASMSDLAQMKYLEAVLKETLRLYPSVPYIGRRITEDFVMGDLFVPKGAEIGVHIYDLHRREDLYSEPEVFRPERFLQNELKHPYAFLPFSAGPRNCIGQRFAMQEMKCFMSEICRNFKIIPKKKGARPTLITDMVLRPIDPIYVKFIAR